VYVDEVPPQTIGLPVIEAGAIGAVLSETDLTALLPHDVFAFTVIAPLVKVGEKVTVILFVPVVTAGIVTGDAPKEELTPLGKVQV
jgi:hypothetical protein